MKRTKEMNNYWGADIESLMKAYVKSRRDCELMERERLREEEKNDFMRMRGERKTERREEKLPEDRD